jgi:hypothetical protein
VTPCAYGDCPEEGIVNQRTALGVERFCPAHAKLIWLSEQEWEQAEDEYHGRT